MRMLMIFGISLLSFAMIPGLIALAADHAIAFTAGQAVSLPKPRMDSGMSLMKSLAQRQSAREFKTDKLDKQTLADLLWAAWGINRPALGKRTAPSARNWQDMTVYVVLESGIFTYDAKVHALVPKIAGDHRAVTGKQDFVSVAPVNLVYVSDFGKLETKDLSKKERYAGSHAGFIAQNVYLYCASAGLATVVRALFDGTELGAALGLNSTQHAILAQTIGWPVSKK